MKKWLAPLALFLLSIVVSVSAQAQWQVPDHAVPIGKGAGFTGFKSAAPGTTGIPLTSNGATSDPTFHAVETAGIADGAVTNAKRANMAANSVSCNPTSSSAAPQDCAATTSGSPKSAFTNHGVVLMTRLPESYTWTVFDGNGAVVDISASTTGGLQEAINKAASQGLCLEVKGGGQKTVATVETDWGTIFTTTGITIPASTKACYHFDGVSLELLMATAADDGITIDSMDMLDFRFSGQIIYSGTGSAVRLVPTNANQESFTGATSSEINIATIVCVVSTVNLAPDSSKGIGLRISSANGVTINNQFIIGEINACNVGMQIDNPGGGHSANLNRFVMPAVHGQGAVGLQIGTSASGTSIYGNFIDAILTPNAQGLNDWGINNQFRLSVHGGTTGVVLNTSVLQSTYSCAWNNATTPLSDSATVKNSNFIGTCWPTKTWTPTLFGTGTAGTPTYTIQVGSWELNNRLVTVRFTVQVTALGGATGNLQVGGLPLTSSNSTNDVGMCFFNYMAGVTLDVNYTVLYGAIQPNTNYVQLTESGSGQTTAQTGVGRFAAATTIQGACSYHI